MRNWVMLSAPAVFVAISSLGYLFCSIRHWIRPGRSSREFWKSVFRWQSVGVVAAFWVVMSTPMIDLVQRRIESARPKEPDSKKRTFEQLAEEVESLRNRVESNESIQGHRDGLMLLGVVAPMVIIGTMARGLWDEDDPPLDASPPAADPPPAEGPAKENFLGVKTRF